MRWAWKRSAPICAIAQAVVAACRGMDAVFHVGGIAGIGGPWNNYYEINTLGTRHVVEGCLRHGVGPVGVHQQPQRHLRRPQPRGASTNRSPIRRRWLCHYARSKALAEQHVLAANGTNGLVDLRAAAALDLGAARPASDSRDCCERARNGRLRRIGDGTNLIDTVYVENAAAAHLLAADALQPGSPVAGRAYFISQGEPVNCWAWIDEIPGPGRSAAGAQVALAVGGMERSARPTKRSTGSSAAARRAAAEPVSGGRNWPPRTTSTSAAPAAISATSRRFPPPKACAGWRRPVCRAIRERR